MCAGVVRSTIDDVWSARPYSVRWKDGVPRACTCVAFLMYAGHRCVAVVLVWKLVNVIPSVRLTLPDGIPATKVFIAVVVHPVEAMLVLCSCSMLIFRKAHIVVRLLGLILVIVP